MTSSLDVTEGSLPREDLKSDVSTDNCFDSNNNSSNADDDVGKTDDISNVNRKRVPSTDGPPDDIRAFYGHPLTAATASANEADTHASAVALLHEYINLPALDRSGMKIGDKINSIYDIMRDDGSSTKVETGSEGDYMQMLQTTLASEVDKFFNQGEDTAVTVLTDDNQIPVSIAEEVINEVCVETASFNPEPVNNRELYVIEQRTVDPNTDVLTRPVSVAMPGLDDLQNSITPSVGSVNKGTSSTGFEKSNHTARRAREPKAQVTVKPQELSKKLVKALAEKIMKRMNQKDHEGTVNKTELETAVSNLPEGTPSVSIENMVTYSQTSENSDLKDMAIDQNHESILENLPENLPVIEAENLDASPVSMTSYQSSLQTSSSVYDISSVSLRKDVKCAQSGTQTNLVNVSQTLESAIVTRHVTPPLYDKEKNYTHAPAQALTTKQTNCLRQNSVPATNQNCFQSHSANSVSNSFPGPNGPPFYYFPDTNSTHFSAYPNPVRSVMTSDNGIMLERYIQQQTPYLHENPNFKGHVKDTCSLKSPDSGFCEPCVSPRELGHVYTDGVDAKHYSEGTESEAEKNQTCKVAKRRKSAPPMYVKQYWNPLDKLTKCHVTKLEKDPAGYKYFLDCPISTTQRIEEDRITYLNKGQYYGLTLEHDGQRTIKCQSVKSIIMVVFRDDKNLEDEKKAWEFWHSRQHSYKQRVIDIDTKNSINVAPNCTEEIAYNAVAVKWNPRDSPAKVNIAVHCLSTDFSNQKGVKGLPLHIQVDTYENSGKDSLPISRGYCQIKVFCDKGAERKIRDEERRKQCRVNKTDSQPATKALRKRHEEVYHEALDKSEFYPMADLQSQPILFTPTFECDDTARQSPLNISSVDEDGSSSITSSGDHYDSAEDGVYPVKRARTEPYTPYQTISNILLYVREKHEVVFTAVMLRSPTLHGLLQAVEEKYNVPVSKIKNSYKRSRKGILVRIDDNIIRHYSHESTFIIELKKVGADYELVLTEIDPC